MEVPEVAPDAHMRGEGDHRAGAHIPPEEVRIRLKERHWRGGNMRPDQSDADFAVWADRTDLRDHQQIAGERQDAGGQTGDTAEEVGRIRHLFLEAEHIAHDAEADAVAEAAVLAVGRPRTARVAAEI